MQDQAGLVFYKFRWLLAAIIVLATTVLVSALVTAIGSNTIVDSRTNTSRYTGDMNISDTSNVISGSLTDMVNGTRHAAIATGSAVYGACHRVTVATSQAGSNIAHGSAVAGNAVADAAAWTVKVVGTGLSAAGEGIAKGAVFTARLPGKAIGSITDAPAMHAIVKPDADQGTPVISETSASVLAKFDKQQQEQISKLMAEQVAANRELATVGAVVAGDPDRGGYPDKWNYAAQDSQLDSWGMYNRECVSYAAWKVYQTFGYMPDWGGIGNANQWLGNARSAGIATGSVPKVHSVAISMRGYYGHAMWVEAVKGNMIYVSQYNYDLQGRYSEMWIDGSALSYIYFK